MKIDYGWTGPGDYRRWGPYVSFGRSAATEVRVSWQSKFFSTERWIEYGVTPECGTRLDSGDAPTPSLPANMHTFRLEGLEPDTTYYFRTSRPEDLQEDPAPLYTFRTGPPDGARVPFDFCVVADVHASDGNATELFRAVERDAPGARFVVSCGDCVTHGGREEAWNNYFFQVAPFSPGLPVMHATGNHDTDHPETYAHFVQTFHQPYHDTRLGAFYHFVYGNAVFVVLDSTNAGQAVATQGVVSDQQMDWLEGVLGEYARGDYWVFVFTHHQVYSTGDSGMMNLYDLAYRGLFDEYHVDGVFYGHDHLFEVYWTGRDEAWGGTHYFLVGNGGHGSTDLRDARRRPKLNYIWKGRTYLPERDGILDGNLEGGIRNDDLVRSSHVYGVLERGFTHLHLDGDDCEVRMWGLENQTYFHDKFRRTGTGKKYHPPLHVQEF
ncbi:MAG: metallophosphoesterase [Promethearchaeota archaeon]